MFRYQRLPAVQEPRCLKEVSVSFGKICRGRCAPGKGSLFFTVQAVTACTVAFLCHLHIPITTEKAEEQSLPYAWGGKQRYPENLYASPCTSAAVVSQLGIRDAVLHCISFVLWFWERIVRNRCCIVEAMTH